MVGCQHVSFILHGNSQDVNKILAFLNSNTFSLLSCFLFVCFVFFNEFGRRMGCLMVFIIMVSPVHIFSSQFTKRYWQN